ncbi:MAG: 4-alpha-glucanotransferase, partial [Longimicrobiales bacterium]
MSVSEGRLHRLARLYGVQTSYHDIEGGLRRATPGALIDALRALGAPLSGPEDVEDTLRARERELGTRALPPVVVAWDGRMPPLTLRSSGRASARLALRLRLEDGEERMWTTTSVGRVRPPWDDLPFGYHELTGTDGGGGRAGRGPTLVISAPLQAVGPEALRADGGSARLWAAFLPLYALETERSWGVGDLTDLAELARWVAAQGGSLLGTLPLLAAFLDEPFEPSPYSPVSRLYWNELYADVSDTRGLDDCPEARAALASAALEDRI